MKILVINGINLNLLGQREKHYYGSFSINEIETKIKKMFQEIDFEFFQSNTEVEIVNMLNNWKIFDGIIINPGAFSHYSIAIRDALEIVKIPKVIVHLSNIFSRENFRQTDILAQVSNGIISGFKEKSYLAAIYIIKELVLNPD